MARKQKQAPSGLKDSFLFDGVQNNIQAPSMKTLVSRQKFYRGFLYTTVFALIPISVLTGLTVVGGNAAKKDVAADSISQLANNSDGRATATIAVNNWLNAEGSPLPGGVIISWDGFEKKTAPPAKNDSQKVEYTQEIHHFTLTANGQIYDSQIVILIDDILGTAVAGTPSLLPQFTGTNSGLTQGAVPWLGWEAVPSPKNVDVAVQTWAEALVSGDRNKLLQVTGDPNESDFFLTLKGVETVSSQIVAVGIETASKKDATVKEVVAQVTLNLVWIGQPLDANGKTKTSPVTYDVLISDANTASPKITSWGGPGSGPSLTKYSVAIKNVTNNPTDTTFSTPGPTSSVSAVK